MGSNFGLQEQEFYLRLRAKKKFKRLPENSARHAAFFRSLLGELMNKDLCFVRPGQTVEIKVESFPFTRYGTVPGEVVHVSGDAVQGNEGEAAQRRAAGANGGQGGEAVYSVRIKLLQDKIQADDRTVALTPGMAVTAEIKIGRRRIIEYILDPVMRYRDESLRER